MPQKIRISFLLVFTLFVSFANGYGQINRKIVRCVDSQNMELVGRAFQSFESDLFEHYSFGNDTIKTYRTFLAEVSDLSLDLRNIPSSSSIQLTRTFKTEVNNKTKSLWVPLSLYENQEAAKQNQTTTDAGSEDVLVFNYRGDFIQCLKSSNTDANFRAIIKSLEFDANISPSLIAQQLHNIPNGDFNNEEVKIFIAFDIYYSILMVIEKAFG